jgi:hypothetical protein
MLCCPLLAAAAAEPVTAYLDSRAELLIALDRSLITQAMAARPTSIYSDPDAAPAMAQVREQLQRLIAADHETPPFLDLIAGGRGLLLMGYPFDGTQAGSFEPDMAVLVASGSSQEVMRAYIRTNFADGHGAAPASVTLQGFTGWSQDEFFAGFNDDVMIIGKQSHVAGLAHRIAPETYPSAPAWMSLDARALVADLRTMTTDVPLLAHLDQVMPRWRTWQPRVTLATTPMSEAGSPVSVGWQSTLTARGCAGLPLRPVDPAVLALARGDQQVVLALGCDAGVVTRLVSAAIAERIGFPHAGAAGTAGTADNIAAIDHAIEAAIGVPVSRIARHLSGDVLVQAQWSVGPVPHLSAVLGLTDGAAADADLAVLATALTAQPDASVTGADHAWSLVSPIGVVQIARTGKRLVVGTDAGEVSALAGGQPGGARLAADAAIQLHVDVPAIATLVLPMAYHLLADPQQGLGDNPIMPLLDMMFGLNQEVIAAAASTQAAAAGATPAPAASTVSLGALILADHDDHQVGQFHRERNASAQAFFATLFPDGNLRQHIDSSFALYQNPSASSEHRLGHGAALVGRTSAGFILVGVVANVQYACEAHLTAEDLAQRLAGWTKSCGPEPAALPIIAIPSPTLVDRRWLPPTAAVLRHLPAWAIAVTRTDDGAVIDEQGMPVLGTIGYAAGVATWFAAQEMGGARALAAQLAQEKDAQVVLLRQRHAAVIASMEHAGAALQALTQGDHTKIPATASALVTVGHLALADCAGLVAGAAPHVAGDLDQVGHWFGQTRWNSNNAPGPVWAVRLDDAWCVYVDAQGGIGYSTELREVPAAPPPRPKGDNDF